MTNILTPTKQCADSVNVCSYSHDVEIILNGKIPKKIERVKMTTARRVQGGRPLVGKAEGKGVVLLK